MADLQKLLLKLDDLWDYCDRLQVLYPNHKFMLNTVQNCIHMAECLLINRLGVKPE